MLARMKLTLEKGHQPNEEQTVVLKTLFQSFNSEYWFGDETIVMDSEQLMMVTADKGFKIEIESITPHQMIVKIRDKYDKAISEVENYQRGTIVQVHVPNIALLTYNEIRVDEDCCTNEIQDLLNEGWRIIAVCPPNAQRRPDYILGRYNSDVNNSRY